MRTAGSRTPSSSGSRRSSSKIRAGRVCRSARFSRCRSSGSRSCSCCSTRSSRRRPRGPRRCPRRSCRPSPTRPLARSSSCERCVYSAVLVLCSCRPLVKCICTVRLRVQYWRILGTRIPLRYTQQLLEKCNKKRKELDRREDLESLAKRIVFRSGLAVRRSSFNSYCCSSNIGCP